MHHSTMGDASIAIGTAALIDALVMMIFVFFGLPLAYLPSQAAYTAFLLCALFFLIYLFGLMTNTRNWTTVKWVMSVPIFCACSAGGMVYFAFATGQATAWLLLPLSVLVVVSCVFGVLSQRMLRDHLE
jgi:hypothetical protein